MTAGFLPVTEYVPDEREHRRRIAVALNRTMAGKLNATLDVTLTPSATSTAILDPRIGATSFIGATPLSSNGAVAVAAGVWFSGQKEGAATINHASAAAVDQKLRLLIIG